MASRSAGTRSSSACGRSAPTGRRPCSTRSIRPWKMIPTHGVCSPVRGTCTIGRAQFLKSPQGCTARVAGWVAAPGLSRAPPGSAALLRGFSGNGNASGKHELCLPCRTLPDVARQRKRQRFRLTPATVATPPGLTPLQDPAAPLRRCCHGWQLRAGRRGRRRYEAWGHADSGASWARPKAVVTTGLASSRMARDERNTRDHDDETDDAWLHVVLLRDQRDSSFAGAAADVNCGLGATGAGVGTTLEQVMPAGHPGVICRQHSGLAEWHAMSVTPATTMTRPTTLGFMDTSSPICATLASRSPEWLPIAHRAPPEQARVWRLSKPLCQVGRRRNNRHSTAVDPNTR